MDAGSSIAVAVGVAAVVGLVACVPALVRDTRRRRARGLGGSLSGVGAGFDAVWRPSAEEAHARWEAQVELPAPAPLAGDRGRMRDGRITIDVAD